MAYLARLFALQACPLRRVFLLFLFGLLAGVAHAQTIRLEPQGSLAEALVAFSRQSGIDVVFADRLVDGIRASCRYEGDDPDQALVCMLADTGLDVRRVGPMQFVVIRASRTNEPPRPATLSGFIRDAASRQPLPGAHVLLTSMARGAATNRAGYFAFPSIPAGDHRIEVTYVGFARLDTVITVPGRPVTLDLKPATLTTDGLLVEADESDRADLSVIPGLVAVPVRQLAQLPSTLGSRDLFGALTWLPGIWRAGEVTGGLIVRGGGPDQHLFLVDGAPVYYPWHAFSLISTFQMDTFKDMRLYRGAFPAEFGGRLVSVLDAELSDGRRAEPHASVALNALNARFLIESPITPSSSFMLSGRRSYVDKLIGRNHPVSDDSGRQDTLRTGYYFYDWSGKLAFRPDLNSRLTFSWYTGRDDLDLRLPFDLSSDLSSWRKPADLLFEIDEFWGNRLFTGRYERLLDARWYLSVTAYDSRYRAREGVFVQPTLTADVSSTYRVALHDLGVNVDVDFFQSLAHAWRTGLRLVDRRFDSEVDAVITYAPGLFDELRQQSDLQAFEAAAYAQHAWRPTPRLHVVSGLRVGFFGGGRHLRWSPRLSAQYRVDPRLLVLRAGLTRNHQFLHQIRDRFSFLYDLVSSRWIPSSENVLPGRADQATVGMESHPLAGLKLTADFYVRSARHVLLPRDTYQSKDGLTGPGIEVGTLLAQYTAGYERAYGVELAATYDLEPWLGVLIYTGSRSSNRAPALGETSYRAARYDVPRALNTFVQRRSGPWTAGLSMIWRSGYPITVPVARYALGDVVGDDRTTYLYRPEINNGRLPPYFRMDLDLAYRFAGLGARWQVGLHLYNVLARRNVRDRVFEPSGLGMRVEDRRGLPLLPLFEIEMSL